MQSIVLISTVDAAGGRLDVFDRMLHSLEEQRAARPDIPLRLFLLVQRCSADDHANWLAQLPGFVQPKFIEHRCSLSKARNLLLEEVLATPLLDSETLVAYPDDDCWYPEGVLDAIMAIFTRDAAADFFFCRYASAPEPAGVLAPQVANAASVVRVASSNTLFLRGSLVTALGPFDENLGVGARWSGGEDTDYAIRAYLKARRSLYLERNLIGHRDPNPALRAQYFTGSLKAISQNAGASAGIFFATLRKLCVGVYYVLRGRLTPAAFISSLLIVFK